MGAPGMTKGMEGGNRLYAGSFWHQVRKKPELWVDKSKVNTLKNIQLKKRIEEGSAKNSSSFNIR
jgi:hypothetical protein